MAKTSLKPEMKYMGNGEVWTTRSVSNPPQVHITVDLGDMVICSCTGHTYHKYCWHQEEVEDPDDDYTD